MENTQSPPNQNLTETAVQRQTSSNNSRLLVTVVISILLTASVAGSIVYFWQKSASEKTIDNLEQKISSLEEQISEMKKEEGVSKPVDSSPVATQAPTLSPVPQGTKLSEIKYTLPEGWEAKMRSDQNDLFLSPKEEGGFLAIKVYPYDGKTGRREYYCQLTKFCIDATYFTPVQTGNISGYKANALDNSGGGPEYFGAKGDKFYVISSFSPSYPPDNYFDRTFQQVIDSLVF
ncbi:hypothetical protein COU96_02590 [Candidatus Shapirobacteria bacterium CG10_big_fil_rev_8_21_14_0_10_38_14]|uniref:Uncharacterized protein n=1 Tax=Candidatus Shapirobacteria bacterium CG10_big_fil_rev_8_21_14_0_10_38_14 TaxID=1974483 RepID=A0A2M8L511_9BACT|nr:MAG: hypothetical protein COU96_02590 [Candidatus Shapirobacteria bacterium CG10_big_fil_rev_8_21_14_0_10_38_14]